ncbi:hypothetical protein [Ekhidna sp.]|uniref:hypothetical protein n=1 Tax=Ekhidna sp. TaxID=2608089 RepID=UPI003BAD0A1F
MNRVLQFWIICSLTVTACNQEKAKTESKPQEAQTTPVTSQEKIFDYQPENPVDGQLNAVIELGAIGLNYFIIEIDDQARWSLKKQIFGRSNIIYGETSPEEIIANIENFQSEILAFGVQKENIHIVISSSAVESSTSDLEAEIRKSGIDVITVNAHQEAEYAMMATIPREFIDESFMVDVGSGNTKLSWVNANDTSTIEIHGSKYFLSEVQDTTVFREVRDAILRIPESNRNLCFMLGGIIYEFAKTEIEETDNRYYVLKAPGAYPTNNKTLKAGNVIYNGLFLPPTYSYIFDNHSNFSIGYLVSLKK